MKSMKGKFKKKINQSRVFLLTIMDLLALIDAS